MGVVWGGGVIFLMHFMLFPTFIEIFFLFRKTIVDRDSGNLYPIYIKKTNCGFSF